MASSRQDAYAQPSRPRSMPRTGVGRLSHWTLLAGTVALPMLLAASLATLAWALPGSGDSARFAALGLSGIAVALIVSAVWVAAASLRARSREVERMRDERLALEAELASVAHDLRAPLVTANSYFELLAEEAFGRLPSEALQAAKRGKVASERARTLAESALRRSLRRGRDDAALDPVDIAAVVSEAVVGLHADLAESDAEIEIRDLPVASCDRDAMYRVFTNLIENAIKYAAPGRRPRILVSGYVEGDFVNIGVRDWGIGIARREQEQVFSLYERAEDVAAGATPGAGIGLATVRQLVQEQGGRVWIDPLVTDGTSVRVALPAAK